MQNSYVAEKKFTVGIVLLVHCFLVWILCLESWEFLKPDVRKCRFENAFWLKRKNRNKEMKVFATHCMKCCSHEESNCPYSRFLRDVTAAMLVYRTIVKKSSGNLIVVLCKT